MNAATQNKVSYSETLKARKAHLNGLISLIRPRIGKATKVENLTIDAINVEISFIDYQQTKRG